MVPIQKVTEKKSQNNSYAEPFSGNQLKQRRRKNDCNMKFPQTTIQDKISYDLGKKSECDMAEISSKKINNIRNCHHHFSPTPFPICPHKKIHGPNMKQMIQIEMVRQARSGPLLLLPYQGCVRQNIHYFTQGEIALRGVPSFSQNGSLK